MSPDDRISDALEIMRRYRISGVPITKNRKLVGILTNRDLRFETRTDIPISKVMTKENLITVPVGTTLDDAEKILHKHRVEKPRSVRWAIADLSRKRGSGIFDAPSILSRANTNRINYLFRYGLYNLPDHRRPICHQRAHSYKSMYGRLSYDELAQTITSGFGSPGQGRFIHPTRPRALTPHEAARLQFFPDSFDFSSVELRTALANMIGNAVATIVVARWEGELDFGRLNRELEDERARVREPAASRKDAADQPATG